MFGERMLGRMLVCPASYPVRGESQEQVVRMGGLGREGCCGWWMCRLRLPKTLWVAVILFRVLGMLVVIVKMWSSDGKTLEIRIGRNKVYMAAQIYVLKSIGHYLCS